VVVTVVDADVIVVIVVIVAIVVVAEENVAIAKILIHNNKKLNLQ
jgi:hypothetical protein